MKVDKYILGVCSGAHIMPPVTAMISGRTGSVSTRAWFPAEHTGFQGHFPGNALLPGFLHIELVLDILRACFKEVELTAVPIAKYILPILPDQIVDVTINIALDGGIAAQLQVAGVAVSVLDLTVSGIAGGLDQKS